MIYRPPLVPHETFVADPPELPVRAPGEQGLSAISRAEVLAAEGGELSLKAETSAGETLFARVAVAGEGVVRVRLSAEPEASSRSAAAISLVRPGTFTDAKVTLVEGGVRIDAGALIAEVELHPFRISFTNVAGRVLLAQNRGEADISGRQRNLPFGRSLVDSVPVAYHESFDARADERFAGLGERFTPLDKRGQRALMWNFDAFGGESDRAYKNVPLYLSSRGYGVLVDSGTAAEFDLAQSTHSVVQILVPDDLIDYYVIAGPTPGQILDRYNGLTSRPSLPPKWAFGTWVSSGFYVDTQEKVIARARRLREDRIPADVMHLDCYWQVAGNWSDFRWDAENFPDPRGMLADLDGMGFKVCLWINPYVSVNSPVYTEGAEAGYFLRRADGEVYVADVWHGNYAAGGIIDFTNAEACDWYRGLLRPLLEQGVATFKTDFAEGVPTDAVASNGMTGAELHNVYTLLYNDLTVEVTREVNGHELVWARSSFLGGQRHSAQWSGDTNTSYPSLGSTIRGGLSHGLSGIPFWSHDAGGFTGRPSDDLYLRWSQFGALSPLVRFHGTTSRLPWDFPEVAEPVTEALRLRYELMPYLYSAAVESARTGEPMMRALLVDSPADPAAWGEDLAYRLGRDLLVAPMTDPDGTRQVYLPAGDWVDYWTGRVHHGQRYISVTVPLERIPLFVRHGAVVPTAEVGDKVGDGPFGPLTVVTWGGVSGRFLLRDVDGDTDITVTSAGAHLDLRTSGPALVRRLVFAAVEGGQRPASVSLNGTKAVLDLVDGRLVATLPE
ncbi:TIM-barrel domain-containing protein [Phytomonospora sp. NPDC050363]|uniref:TIM-barrel domain-containing protein n=1 Tax=Phytomonospora sp. NPDC050363 TaxID=3155642 RepID=UPI0033DF34ED